MVDIISRGPSERPQRTDTFDAQTVAEGLSDIRRSRGERMAEVELVLAPYRFDERDRAQRLFRPVGGDAAESSAPRPSVTRNVIPKRFETLLVAATETPPTFVAVTSQPETRQDIAPTRTSSLSLSAAELMISLGAFTTPVFAQAQNTETTQRADMFHTLRRRRCRDPRGDGAGKGRGQGGSRGSALTERGASERKIWGG